ncbi:RluA family pseudouridine synthase [Lampropedia puyangensis]|uniref:Pseudouridine synthase n=1 Tax=Lampropedia puyangensis TaxID=1330072 RepID=A0A4S8F6U1_9BURK|nr:RluA family pseudouridine synthase [Lampropedia puyangensis]THU01964.1 RluA family pseudouridine synthase [Lampropedia puyangensis]
MNTSESTPLAAIADPDAIGDEASPIDVDAAGEERSMDIGVALHGQRLDKALLELAPEFSRNHLQHLVKEGWVTLGGAVVVKPAQKVSAGQTLRVQLQPTAQSQAFLPEVMPLNIVYEDAHLLVVNKPAGLVVHPAAGNWSGTLLNGLLAYHPVFSTLPRAGIVHRLDKDTSGLMVVAKSLSMVAALVEMIARRDVSRQYVAIAKRAPHARTPWREWGETVVVDAAIGRDSSNRLRMAVVDLMSQSGKTAQTDMTLWASCQDEGDYALLHCRLHTGRTHQIRVHAKHLGWPLVGDAIYGGAPHVTITRQALHAWCLGFEHPVTRETLSWQAPLPLDIQALLGALHMPQPDGL